jgi:hypothetical protein
MSQKVIEYRHGHTCGVLGYSSVDHFGIKAEDYSVEQQELFRRGFLAGKAEQIIRKPYQLPTMHRIVCQ